MESLQTVIYFLPELCDRVNIEPAIMSSQPHLALSHGSWQGKCWEYWTHTPWIQLVLKKFSVLFQPITNVAVSISLYKSVFFHYSFENRKLQKVSIKNRLTKKHKYQYFHRIPKLHFLIILLFITCLFFTNFIKSKATEKNSRKLAYSLNMNHLKKYNSIWLLCFTNLHCNILKHLSGISLIWNQA